RVRYKIGFRSVFDRTGSGPAKQAFIDIKRFNVGPTLRKQSFKDTGTRSPAEAFGVGPHVGWRIVMAPGPQHNAEVIGITRKELANYKARTTDCFDIGCLSIAAVSGPPGDWRKHPTPAFDEPENVTGPKTWPDSSVTTAAAAVSRYIFGDDGYGEAIEGA